MKKIFVIREENEVITARDTMDNAVAACMNRISICGYLCEEFSYEESLTLILYRDPRTNAVGTIIIEETNFKEGV